LLLLLPGVVAVDDAEDDAASLLLLLLPAAAILLGLDSDSCWCQGVLVDFLDVDGCRSTSVWLTSKCVSSFG